jgi:hypothetical protein
VHGWRQKCDWFGEGHHSTDETQKSMEYWLALCYPPPPTCDEENVSQTDPLDDVVQIVSFIKIRPLILDFFCNL